MPPNEVLLQSLTAAATTLSLDGRGAERWQREIPVETGVSIVYSGIPFAVMMATPADLEDFGIGFSLTEGIISTLDDVRDVRVATESDGIRLEIDLAPQRLRRHLGRQRAIIGRTSCGICGVEDLAALKSDRGMIASAPSLRLSAIRRALRELDGRQALNRATHAVHGAAWATLDGRIQHLREDVGRHNALDKLIGALTRQRIDPATGMVLVTSRCSYEMIEKTAAFGAATIVAISAPTSLAIERATALGMTLVALARRDAVTLFQGDERVIDDLTSEASAA